MVKADSATTANATDASSSQTVTVQAPPASYTAPTTAVGTTSAKQTAYTTFTTAGTPGAISVTT